MLVVYIGASLVGGFIIFGIYCAIDNMRNGRDAGAER